MAVNIRELNLLFKLIVSGSIIIFALIYQSIWYNLIIIMGSIAVLYYQKIRLFRFKSVSYGFALFLFFIFCFRALSGYGKIIIDLPLQLQITTGGLYQAILTVEQFLLIFLLMACSIYTSSRYEFLFYLEKLNGTHKEKSRWIYRFGLLVMFVLHLLPEMFRRGDSFRQELTQDQSKSKNVKQRFVTIVTRIGDFVVFILRQAEALYPEFVNQSDIGNYRPYRVNNFRHTVLFAAFLGIHIFLFWM